MAPSPQSAFVLAEAREVLERMPGVLRYLLAGASEAWLDCREGEDTWSPSEILAHLTDLEETDWMVRTRMILERGEAAPFAPIDRVAFRESLRGLGPRELLDRFEERRARNLSELDTILLSEATLGRRGIHPEFGPVTLAQLLATWVAHDLSHLAQIARVMAKRYAGAVGPWAKYLSVLQVPGAGAR